MPKKKKTLKQKQQTDMRRHAHTGVTDTTETKGADVQTSEAAGNTFSLPQSYTFQSSHAQAKTVTQKENVHILTHEYKYLGRDLFKTAFLTGAIVIVEIIIRFIFERG